LWGRALARVKTTDSVLYSLLSRGDFEKAEAGEEDLVSVLRELIDNTSNYKIIGLLSEVEGGVKILMAVHLQIDIKKFSDAIGKPVTESPLNLGTFKVLDVTLNGLTLAAAEEQFLAAL